MSALLIIDQPPYGSWAGRETLDMAFSLAAFDQQAAILFTGAGVNWLRTNQDATGIGQKCLEKNLSAAPIFGIDQIFADSDACQRFGLADHNLLPGTTLVASVRDTLAQFESIIFAG